MRGDTDTDSPPLTSPLDRFKIARFRISSRVSHELEALEIPFCVQLPRTASELRSLHDPLAAPSAILLPLTPSMICYGQQTFRFSLFVSSTYNSRWLVVWNGEHYTGARCSFEGVRPDVRTWKHFPVEAVSQRKPSKHSSADKKRHPYLETHHVIMVKNGGSVSSPALEASCQQE